MEGEMTRGLREGLLRHDGDRAQDAFDGIINFSQTAVLPPLPELYPVLSEDIDR